MASKAKPITAAGRTRVAAAMARHHMLLIQGQWELPSIADLLAGTPVTTKGYSWDYVPAWRHAAELAAQPDYADLKLFRGRSMIVQRELWPVVESLARVAQVSIRQGAAGVALQEFLALIEEEPGLSGATIKTALGLDGKAGTRDYQKRKRKLEEALCVTSLDLEEVEQTASHTHEQLWYPWRESKVALACRTLRLPSPPAAAEQLLACFDPPLPGLSARARASLFPVLRFGND